MRKKTANKIRVISTVLLLLFLFVILGISLKNKQIFSTKASIKKVIGGEDAKPSEFPYMAVIFFDGQDKGMCGGTLVKKKFVLTADHCLYDTNGKIVKENKIRIFFNKTYIKDLIDETDKRKFYKAKKLHSFNKFYNFPNNDIALIELEEAPKNIPSVTLITKNQENFYRTGNEVTVIGYGANYVFTLLPPPAYFYDFKLKKIKFPLIDGPEHLKEEFPEMMHFGYEGESSLSKTTSKGDSGSPILYRAKGRFGYKYYQIGVVSGSWGGVIEGYSQGVRVISYLDSFINSVTNKNY